MSRSDSAGLAAHAVIAAGEALYVTSADGVIRYWSPAAEELFGFSAQDALGSNAAQLLSAPGGEEPAREAFFEAVATEYAFAELQRCAKDGRELTTRASLRRVANEHGGEPYLAVAERDLTDVQRAEAQLFAELRVVEEAQSLLKTVLDSAREFAIMACDPDGAITLWSAGAERLFVCRGEDIRGPDGAALLERLSGPESVSLPEVFRRAITEGAYDGDFEAMTKGGRAFPANVAARPRMDQFGEVAGVVAVVQDLTQRERVLRERDAALEEAQQARAAALAAARAKADFLASMSHEIRTPMNAVLGMLQLLDRTDLTGQQGDYVDKAQTAATALLQIIDDILDFSKIEAGKLQLESQPFSIDELLRDIAVILGANVGDKFVEILFNVDPELPRFLSGDAHRLKQILINLAGNALKFTERGEVVLAVRMLRQEAEGLIVEFSVRDTGIGMSAEQQQRLFQAFSQAEAGTTRRFGGTGLGLVICQRLIRLMDGELTVQSALGQGSTFAFTIPLERAEGEPETASRRLPPPALSNLRVLIVDDNPQAREILANLAQSLGWQADVAASGEAALSLIAARSQAGESYHMAFVDWAMPGMDGWQTAAAIRAAPERRALPTVVMVTAHSREALEHKCGEERDLIAGFLVKPVTASDILDAAANSLAGREPAVPRRRKVDHGERLAGLRVLVVDDNLSNQQIARELLAHEGAIVEIAGSGQAALGTIRSASAPFDAVLMDIQMPKMDGYTATRKIRTELGLRALPIIAMTANVLPADREAGLAAGMNDYVAKPYHVDQIVTTLLERCGRQGEAAPASVPARNHLPSPPGFAFAEALLRLGNNKTLYANQARAFAATAAADCERIRALLQQGATQAAGRELHTLKGLAGTLGAQVLAEHLKLVEEQVKDSAAQDQLADLLGRAETLCDEACRSLARLADELEGAAEVDTTPADPVLSDEELDAQFSTLEVLLAESNMHALEVFAQLRKALPQADADELAAIAAALDVLDFPTALERLRDLRRILP